MKARGKISLITVLGSLLLWSLGAAREPPGHHHTTVPTTKAKEPVRITMEELHRHGGIPPGWQFTLPAGDPEAGRAVFVKLECYSCHEIQGEKFPASGTERRPGPDLARMGDHHPAEYLAESVLDPNAVIVDEAGFTGEDGRSTVPSYADLLTLEQWIDLSAYLKSLTAGHPDTGAPHSGTLAFSLTEAPRRINSRGTIRCDAPSRRLVNSRDRSRGRKHPGGVGRDRRRRAPAGGGADE